MKLKLLLSAFFMLSPSLGAQSHILNPQRLEIPSEIHSLPLSHAEESQWLKTFYSQLPLEAPLNSTIIKDENGESLKEKLELSSYYYLGLDYLKSSDLADEASELFSRSLPYQSMKSDAIKLFAMQLLLSTHFESYPQLPKEILPLLNDPEFLDRLPIKTQEKLKKVRVKKFNFVKEKLPFPAQRIFLNGKEVKLPQRIYEGRYLVHFLRNSTIENHWLLLEENNFKFKKIEVKNLWTSLSKKTLKEELLRSRPIQLPKAGIILMSSHESGKTLPLVISAPKRKKQIPIQQAQIDWARELEKDFQLEQEEAAPTFLKSPWFWLVTGAIASASGYLIYDAMQGPVIVRTP